MEQEKRILRLEGKEHFFLGRSDDTNYYLEEATYDCKPFSNCCVSIKEEMWKSKSFSTL